MSQIRMSGFRRFRKSSGSQNVRISDVSSETSENRTQFCPVCQTGRPVFGHLLYLEHSGSLTEIPKCTLISWTTHLILLEELSCVGTGGCVCLGMGDRPERSLSRTGLGPQFPNVSKNVVPTVVIPVSPSIVKLNFYTNE